MSSAKNPLGTNKKIIPMGQNRVMGIVVSKWNNEITDKLLSGCLATLNLGNVPSGNIDVLHVPGTFELPSGAAHLFTKRTYDAVICLGCVIKGETKHDDYINHAVANGLVQLSLRQNKPVIFGVLTVNNEQQAKDRAGGKYGNKGVEAAQTALEMAHLFSDSKS